MSAFIANVLHPGVVADIETAKQVEHLLAGRAFSMAYQPVVDVADGRVVFVEALARFDSEPYRSPDLWFRDAWQSGLGAELELAAVEAALADLDRLPDGARLAVNLSPPVVTRPRLRHLLGSADPSRVVIELTEHAAIDDYPRVRNTLASLRDLGVRLAVDDTGAGFASLSHIIKLAPDLIKLDYELIHGIASDPVRRSLATAIVGFAADIGSDIVAEGIETADELDVVRTLGIRYGQGYLLGRPGSLDGIGSVVPVGPTRQVDLDGLVARMGRRGRTRRVARLGRSARLRRVGRSAAQ
jgi:EAL domain-containing protein (putative c-di-GMP-specific phosphodiesterase class I)